MENEKKSGRGGYRPGAGRKPGSKNKKSAVAGLAKSRSVTLSAGEWEELEKLAGSISVTRYAADILRAFLVARKF